MTRLFRAFVAPVVVGLGLFALLPERTGSAPQRDAAVQGKAEALPHTDIALPQTDTVSSEVRLQVQNRGRARVIVELALVARAHLPEGRLTATLVAAQRGAIEAVQRRVIAKLSRASHRVVRRYRSVPFLALEVGLDALAELEGSRSDVVRVITDDLLRTDLADSVPLIQGDQAWSVGFDGEGATIAVLDTGVEASHPFLAGKVVEEACFSSNVAGQSTSVCPGGQDEEIGPGAARPCVLDGCYHGTHVAGIAAGLGSGAGQPFSGVARGAELAAVQVFSQIDDPFSCGGMAPCLAAWTSDIIAGLEWVYSRRADRAIAAANMSLGGGLYSSPCDNQPYKPIIDNLRSVGIATIVASGNNGSTSSIAAPACISSAVSVASTTKTDAVSWFSNVAPFVSLFATGETITSSVPSGAFGILSGTSMAAPHVAGAWAVLKQARPEASVAGILATLQQTGLSITDTRFLGAVTRPRIQTYEALSGLVPIDNPPPTLTGISPSSALAGTPGLTLTATGSGFVAGSVVRWNGADRATSVVNVSELRAVIPASDLAASGQAQVSVFTPEPGGGSTTVFPFTINEPPTLSVDVTTVAPGGSATVTLTHGLGGATDWLGLFAVGAGNNVFLQWTYVGAGVTTRTWTVTMPTTPGPYEFRLFVNNSYTRVATSPTVTVEAAQNPVPAITSLSPSSATAGGPAFTLVVRGSGFVSGSVVRWNGADRATTFASSTELRAAIPATDLAVSGTAQVTVFTPAPGGGTSAALPFTIGPAPTLSVNVTTVPAGGSVTTTLANGPGGATDWLALAAAGAPNTSYLQWTYVGAGVTNRTWTVTMPATPGPYEFRLFLNGGYTRAATSPTVTVEAAPNPLPSISSLSPGSAVVGGAGFTLTVNGSGFTAASVARWNGANRATTFFTATQVRAAIPASDLAVAGAAEVTVFNPAPGGGTSNAVSFIVSAQPVLTVNLTSVRPGASVTVTLTNGLGGATDWLALAATGAPNTSYLQWTYVGAGLTTRTWTVTMPATPGTYEFRLFTNNSYNRVATSPTVTVTP